MTQDVKTVACFCSESWSEEAKMVFKKLITFQILQFCSRTKSPIFCCLLLKIKKATAEVKMDANV